MTKYSESESPLGGGYFAFFSKSSDSTLMNNRDML